MQPSLWELLTVQGSGHASLGMTQRYIEGDSDAKRKLVNLI